MKEETMMIDAIAKEINRHYRVLKEGLLKKELNDNLKEKLNIDDGLADLDSHILDPALGTGNFLAEVLRLAIKENTKKYGPGILTSFIHTYFLNNISGFEIMLPLYIMALIDLWGIIGSVPGSSHVHSFYRSNLPTMETPDLPPIYPPALKALSKVPGNLYLTDTLKKGLDIITGRQKGVEISKAKMPVMVILGNPPYSRHSLNKGEQITQLLRDYFQVNDRRMKEKNLKGLQDDYVKFFRLAQWAIDGYGQGVLGFIANNGYLENPTYRGMRYSLLNSFDEIYILDLHGTAMKGKVAVKPVDENVFDVSQGIAIGFFIKQKKSGCIKKNPASLNCKVFYYGITGSRESKFEFLEKFKQGNYKDVPWERVFPGEEYYLFTPGKQVDIYREFIRLTDIFPVHSVGIVTARDKLTIKWSVEEMYKTVLYFSQLAGKFAREKFKLGEDTRDWYLTGAQEDIIDSGIDINKIVPVLYRPFDTRFTYYTGKSRGFHCMPRSGVMRHMLLENLGLISVRQVASGTFSHCFVTDTIIESRVTTSRNGISYIFPLDIYVFPGEKKEKHDFNSSPVFPGIKKMPIRCNINPVVFERLEGIFGKDKLPTARQIFYYIYAILNCRIYRERYRDHLKIDFPRIPFNVKPGLFMILSGLGEDLVEIHLMKSVELDYTFSKFEVNGDNLVKEAHYKPTAGTGRDGRVYIDETQYFSNITKEIWEFEICGYQVSWKWLKDRKNRVLSTGEILHYIKICRVVQLTIEKYKQIDRLYSELEKDL